MVMHAARLSESDRLRRVHDLLMDGRERSTREIVDGAHVVAVNSAVAELRENGCEIECRRVGPAWLYRMTKAVRDEFPGGGPVGVRPWATANPGKTRWRLLMRGERGFSHGATMPSKARALREAERLNGGFAQREAGA